MKCKKVYLAGAISDTDRKIGQQVVAKQIRELGYEVYAASENNSINDKSNNPTPIDIYNGDIDRVKECDIFVVRLSGAGEDGTISEIGMVAGWNEAISKLGDTKYEPIKIIAYTTNERLQYPQFWNKMASAGINHLVCGMIDRWGKFVGNQTNMLLELERMGEDN